MSQITGGRVVYKRTKQPREYESQTAEIEFTFTVEDGEDADKVAAEAIDLARAEVHTALGLKESKR